MSDVLAIIPARGGSKGIPRKNLAMCGGRPLIDWTIEAAKASRYVTQTVVSSEDWEILRHAVRGGAHGLMRPVELASDETPTEPVIAHALQAMGGADLVVLLQPTSPLRRGEHIDEAIALLRSTGADAVVSVVRSHALLWGERRSRRAVTVWTANGPVQAYSQLEEVRLRQPLYDPLHRPRRQDLEQYEENGAIYVFRRELWERTGCRLGGRTELYVMDEKQRLQVDSALDLEVLDWMLTRSSLPTLQEVWG